MMDTEALVFVVADDASLRTSLQDLLESAGLRVAACARRGRGVRAICEWLGRLHRLWRTLTLTLSQREGGPLNWPPPPTQSRGTDAREATRCAPPLPTQSQGEGSEGRIVQGVMLCVLYGCIAVLS